MSINLNNGVPGNISGSAITAGFVGERVSSGAVGPTNFPTSTQLGDLASITLTAGEWDIVGSVYFVINGATCSAADMGVSSNAGNNGAGLSAGDNDLALGNTVNNSATVAGYRVTAAGTYYLKYRATYTGGPPQAYGRISARRIA